MKQNIAMPTVTAGPSHHYPLILVNIWRNLRETNASTTNVENRELSHQERLTEYGGGAVSSAL